MANSSTATREAMSATECISVRSFTAEAKQWVSMVIHGAGSRMISEP
jgi:hypothetical protein